MSRGDFEKRWPGFEELVGRVAKQRLAAGLAVPLEAAARSRGSRWPRHKGPGRSVRQRLDQNNLPGSPLPALPVSGKGRKKDNKDRNESRPPARQRIDERKGGQLGASDFKSNSHSNDSKNGCNNVDLSILTQDTGSAPGSVAEGSAGHHQGGRQAREPAIIHHNGVERTPGMGNAGDGEVKRRHGDFVQVQLRPAFVGGDGDSDAPAALEHSHSSSHQPHQTFAGSHPPGLSPILHRRFSEGEGDDQGSLLELHTPEGDMRFLRIQASPSTGRGRHSDRGAQHVAVGYGAKGHSYKEKDDAPVSVPSDTQMTKAG